MKLILKLFGLALLLMAGSNWAAVNINTATQSELENVKGLGPSKAKAIIDYREKNGAFKSVDDLDKVKGFGKASVDKLKPELSVDSAKRSAAEKSSTKPPVKTTN
jgi:competence protein ComEA